jgi:hypothetical protein
VEGDVIKDECGKILVSRVTDTMLTYPGSRIG